MKLRVGICEDDPFTLATLSAALELEEVEISFAATNASDAIDGFKNKQPAAVLLDLHLGEGPTGLDLSRNLRKISPDVGIVFLTSFESPKLIASDSYEMPSGSQYINKREANSIEVILRAIQQSIKKDRKTSVPDNFGVSGLTNKQLSVLQMIAQGHTNSEISKQLAMNPKSVEGMSKRIATKLGLEPDQNKNQRIQMAKAYLKGIGRVLD